MTYLSNLNRSPVRLHYLSIMTCQIMQLQTFAPYKIVVQHPTSDEERLKMLITRVTAAVRKVMYDGMPKANKIFFDDPNCIYKKNRTMGSIAVKYIVIWTLIREWGWTQRRAATVFNLDRTSAYHAIEVVESYLSSRAPNEYKDIIEILK